MKTLPENFRRLMNEILPDKEAESLLNTLSYGEPSVGVRINPLKRPDTDPLEGYATDGNVPWCDEGTYLRERPVFSLNPLLHAGCFYVQDPSSMVYSRLASKAVELTGENGSPMHVLDMCAAPGGKTTAVIPSLPDGSVVCANEFVPQRAAVLRENLAKWGYPHTIVTNSPTDRFADMELFDIVCVDAPCSGEGMMRKDDDAVAQWNEGLVEQCARLQREILGNAVSALRPGGVLIYSTCTFNPTENEENVKWLTEEYGLTAVDTGLTGLGGIKGGIGTDIPVLRFMPHATRGEGLFAAMLVKPDLGECGCHTPYAAPQTKKQKAKWKGDNNTLSPSDKRIIGGWLRNLSGYRLEMTADGVRALSEGTVHVKEVLERCGARVLSAGVPLAEKKGKGYAPHPLLPLSLAFDRESLPSAALTTAEALSFLRKESITLAEGTPRGFVTVTCNGVPLGLVNNLGNRSNNLWPSPWKLRITGN